MRKNLYKIGFLFTLCLFLGVLAQAQSLLTSYTGGNSGDAVYFNINATNNVTITGFQSHFINTGAGSVSVYQKAGTYVGSEGNAAAWTLVGTVAITSAGSGAANAVSIPISGVNIPAGTTSGFYLIETTSKRFAYNNGSGTHGTTISASDANIAITDGANVDGVTPFNGGGINAPRNFNGRIFYTGPTIPTMSQWGVFIFGLLIMNLSVFFVQVRELI